jgi:diacylglycerol kinase (ATP)
LNPNCCILFNAHAGALHAKAGPEHLKRMAEEIGLDAEVIGTESKEEMVEVIRQAVREGVKKVAVSGGDGTVHLAVQELAKTETTLGIIPQGTANNFATALRLPLDLPSALRVLQDGEVRKVDLGKVENVYFTEAAGVGLFADALALYGVGTNKSLLRGVYAMLRVFFSASPRRLKLTIDGDQVIERAVMCAVANSYRMGAAVPVAPGAKVTDGELDVVIVGDLTRSELIPYYRAFRAQIHMNLPKVSTHRARTVTIETRRPANVHCDDTVVGTTPVTITAQPGALKVLVDRL